MDNKSTEKNLPRALIAWYDFAPWSKILFISGGNAECEVLIDVLKERNVEVTVSGLKDAGSLDKKFDYIVGAGIIEKHDNPTLFLQSLYGLLKPNGKLFIGAENRLGIRYFCGDKDVYSNRVFDSIDGYSHVSAERRKVIRGRAYSKAEIRAMLLEAGFVSLKFYSVMPGLTRPQILMAEDYMPNESMDIRVFPQYHSPDTIFLEEERMYQTLIDNQMFHQMANAYLIECAVDDNISDFDQITVQGDRVPNEALATIIRKNKDVTKKALYPQGKLKIRELLERNQYLAKHNIPVIKACIKDDSYIMPYVNGSIATEYFQQLLLKDRTLFLQEFERFKSLVLSSSEHVPYEEVDWRHFDPNWEKRKKDDPNMDKWEKLAFGTYQEQQEIGVILKRGYVDMVSLNCFHNENGFLFFDQEFYVENFPANVILVRTIDIIYRDRYDLELAYPREELLQYYHLSAHVKTWRRYSRKFLEKLRNEKELSIYHRVHRRDERMVAANRLRMNYSQEEYDKLFTNIFKGIENRKIYLFGSGQFAQKFIEQFAKYCEIAGIVDNNKDRWGQEINCIKINPPASLLDVKEPFKVFICIKFFDEVLKQIKEMGINNYALYNPGLEYDLPIQVTVAAKKDNKPKKYHIGYVAGVFDLFHIGHLNLLRRAKEQCDYLIAGVVSDKQVINDKKTKPYISFDDRLAIVQACRYVDKAVGIPADKSSTEAAYHMYHFDVQFSGSDYENDPLWLSQKEFLRRHGSDVVFLPYTKSISSTKIKEQIYSSD